MANHYVRLYYHVTWVTKGRLPLISTEMNEPLWNYLSGKVLELGGISIKTGGVHNHIHLVLVIPPDVAVSTFIGKLKGSSSHWVSHVFLPGLEFAWQDGFGAFTLTKKACRGLKNMLRTKRTITVNKGFTVYWNPKTF